MSVRDTRLGRFVRAHGRLHAVVHGSWCRILSPFDTKRRATTGSGAAAHGATTGGTAGVTVSNTTSTHTLSYPGGPPAGPVLFQVKDVNGNTIFQQSFPNQAEADAYLKVNFTLSPTGSVGANESYNIFGSNSAILEYGFIISSSGLPTQPAPVTASPPAPSTRVATNPTGTAPGSTGYVPTSGTLGPGLTSSTSVAGYLLSQNSVPYGTVVLNPVDGNQYRYLAQGIWWNLSLGPWPKTTAQGVPYPGA